MIVAKISEQTQTEVATTTERRTATFAEMSRAMRIF